MFTIEYVPKKSWFVVHVERLQFKKEFNSLGGRWSETRKGYLVDKVYEKQVLKLKQEYEKSNLPVQHDNLSIQEEPVNHSKNIQMLETMKTTKKSRKTQKKYHRAVSDTESEDEPVCHYYKEFSKSPENSMKSSSHSRSSYTDSFETSESVKLPRAPDEVEILRNELLKAKSEIEMLKSGKKN